MADSKSPPSRDPLLEIDFSALWQVMVERRRLIAVITAVMTFLSVIYALILPPVYRAEVLLMPLSQNQGSTSMLTGQVSELAALTGFSFTGSSDAYVQRALATLKSRALTESFMKEAGVLQAMYASMWDPGKKAWKSTGWSISADPPAGPSMESAYRAFSNGICTVQFDRKTNLTTVTIDWSDPKLAAEWANKLVRFVNAHMQAEAVRDAERNIEYLREQLGKNASVELQQSIYNLIEAQMKAKMVASTREEYAFKVIDPAAVPERKLKPSRRAIVMVGGIFGLLLGIAIAFLQPRLQPIVQPYLDQLRKKLHR